MNDTIMKKMIREPDRFELAAMRTLAKANKMGSYVNRVTIGPNAMHEDKENCEEVKEVEDPTPIEVLTRGVKRQQADETENPKLYVAKALREMENIRQLNVTDNVNERILKLVSLENELQSKMKENLKLSKEEIEIKNRLQSKMLEKDIHNEDLVVSQRMYELIRRYMDDKLKNEEKLANDLRNREEEMRLKEQRIQALCQIENEFHDRNRQILDIIQHCKNGSKLISQCGSDFNKAQELFNNFNTIRQKVNESEINDQDVETCQIMLQCLSVIVEKLRNNAALVNSAEEELLAQAALLAQIPDTASAIVPDVIEQDEPEIPKESAAENESDLETCICPELMEKYVALCDQYEKFSKRVEAFVSSTPSKAFLRNLKIAVGTPMNAVSSTDRSHMRDKFIKISQFLRGNFTLPDTPMPNALKQSSFPLVVDHLCKNFISHAENRFTPSAPREAYVLASLALAIWSEFPDFGPVLLANILKKCPYAIPAYWPRYSGQSDQDYYTLLGYRYKNDKIEEQRSFCTRMTGIFMFYISIMATPFRRNRSHLHGIENAWKWIAALLNMEPCPQFAVVMAEFLTVFLETCGFKLSQCYGTQFRKIVQLLIDEYIDKIEKITPQDNRGPLSRLKLYVVENDVLRKGFRAPTELRCVDDWL